MRSFKSGPFPKSDTLYTTCLLWQRASELLEDEKGSFRFEGPDFISYGNPLAFWPPPMKRSGAYASKCWEFEVADFSSEAAKTMMMALGITAGAVFRKCKPHALLTYLLADFITLVDEESTPLHAFYLRVVESDKEVKDSFVLDIGDAKVELKYVPRCHLCGRGSLYNESHDAVQCPLLGTMNKVRAQQGLVPLTIKDGAVLRVDREVSIDAAKEIKKLRERVVALEDAVKKLSDVKGDKQKDAKGKRKADDSAPGPSTATKKQKGGKKGDDAKGTPAKKGPNSGAGGGGKGGKGKAKATN